MQMAGHTLSATESAIRSSMVAKPSTSHTVMSFDAFMERTIADMYSSSLPGPQELGCWMAGRRYDRVLAAKHLSRRTRSVPLPAPLPPKRCRSAGLSNVRFSRNIVSPRSFENQTREFAHLANSLAVKGVRNIGTL